MQNEDLDNQNVCVSHKIIQLQVKTLAGEESVKPIYGWLKVYGTKWVFSSMYDNSLSEYTSALHP